MYPESAYTNKGDGIKMQAVLWREALESRGHQVDCVSPWNHYDLKEYDIIHLFGFGLWIYDFISYAHRLNENIVYSPIIDTLTSLKKYKLYSYLGCKKLGLFSKNYALRLKTPEIKQFLVRSEYEASYVRQYDAKESQIGYAPLSCRFEVEDFEVEKEDYCLFVGTMAQERKNVGRLIDAAKAKGFRLVLVGNQGTGSAYEHLIKRIDNAPNIELKGFVSEEELQDLYRRAKVFALPSINEGVGYVALEAAMYQCNIVITNIGGPKEYYITEDGTELAYLVNPYDSNAIGNAVLAAMSDSTQQPRLRDHLKTNFNKEVCTDKLISCYKEAMK